MKSFDLGLFSQITSSSARLKERLPPRTNVWRFAEPRAAISNVAARHSYCKLLPCIKEHCTIAQLQTDDKLVLAQSHQAQIVSDSTQTKHKPQIYWTWVGLFICFHL